MYEVIMKSAAWSITSNCLQHPRVREICDNLCQGQDLNQSEKEFLKTILAKIDESAGSAANGSDGHWNTKNPIDTEQMKSSQGFGAMLLSTDNPEKFIKDWEQPTPEVSLSTSESVKLGKPFVVFIVFTGCGADEHGMADVTAEMFVIKPDEKISNITKGMEVCQNQAPPPKEQLQLSVGNLMVDFEPNDPDGVYEVRAKVTDRVKNVVLELKKKFTVSKN
jgi:hypothetical protein